MKHFESRSISVEKPAESIYDRFTDFNNFRDLIPMDKVEKFDCTASSCLFVIKGMPEIALEIIEKQPFSKVEYATKDAKPIDMHFGFNINTTSENTSDIVLYIDANVDGFMAMAVSKPLQNLLNMMADKLEKN
ncbi:MAG: hypothetical protein PHR20_02565 [Bacteroidales bacterium]|nr:hypothetical protein [Bacteroidales bacterium]